jgi:hypothetical protein
MLSSNFAQSGTALTPMNSPALFSNANCTRADASRACRMWRDYVKNTVERRSMRQKKFGKDSFDLRPLQPPEITQNRQSFLWKSLEQNIVNLEKLGEKAWARLYFTIFSPSPNPRRPSRTRAIRCIFTYYDWYYSSQERQRSRRSRNVAALAERVVCCAGRARWQNGVAARKWRRNGLKRLNSRPEMVWPRKTRTHKMWYTGAWLTCATPNDEPPERQS